MMVFLETKRVLHANWYGVYGYLFWTHLRNPAENVSEKLMFCSNLMKYTVVEVPKVSLLSLILMSESSCTFSKENSFYVLSVFKC